MKLKPLNNNVLLKAVVAEKEVDFFESEVNGDSVGEYEVIAMPVITLPCDNDISVGDSVFVHSLDVAKTIIDGVECYVAALDDLYLLRTD